MKQLFSKRFPSLRVFLTCVAWFLCAHLFHDQLLKSLEHISKISYRSHTTRHATNVNDGDLLSTTFDVSLFEREGEEDEMLKFKRRNPGKITDADVFSLACGNVPPLAQWACVNAHRLGDPSVPQKRYIVFEVFRI